MKKWIILICGLIYSVETAFALPTVPTCDQKDYACYQQYVNFCKDKWQPWNTDSLGLWAVTKSYPEFSTSAVQKSTQDLINSEKYPSEKTKLQNELSWENIGKISGFRMAEIARIQYRTNMNRIFSCAVIASRTEKIKKIKELIKGNENTNIGKKLDLDVKKLEALKQSACATNLPTNTTNDYSKAIATSATVEYCSYRYYLEYISQNLESNYTEIAKKDKELGQSDGSTPILSKTLLEAGSELSQAQKKVRSDIDRAASSLPKALVAYREMDRTYITHVMLLIIYDDYIDLRKNLSTYLNAVSQLFKKAQNAQSANK